MKMKDKKKVLAVKIDYLRRSSRVSRRDRITNTEIRHGMNANETNVDRIEKNKFKMVWTPTKNGRRSMA